MTKIPAKCLAGFALLVFCAVSFAQNSPEEVHASLRLADTKTTYRIGEPVRLILELTADREGYVADTTPDSHEPPTDTISVSPDEGVNHWLEEYFSGGYRDYSTRVNLTKSPTPVGFSLNDSIRFDRPGRYTIKVTTRRVFPTAPPTEFKPAITLTTNDVTVDIEAMSDADEANEVRRISGLIEAARGWQAEEAAGRQLSFLTGDVSTREKVRRFLSDSNKSSNYQAQIYYGLFIARNRALALQLLETAMRDPNTPVTHSLLGVVTRLHLMSERAGVARKPVVAMPVGANGDPRATEIRDAYVTQLAAGLDKRSGKSQTTTAMTILMNLPNDPQLAAPFLSQVRRILISQFDTLHPFDQEYLLRVKGDDFRDPSLVPSLKKMLGSSGIASKNIHDTALKRLMEISPDEARLFVLAEIRDPNSFVDQEILGSLPDKTLPEVDSTLLEQIRQFASSASNPARIHLQYKTAVAARYASKAIYADMMEIYRNVGDKMPSEALPGFLAYFARHDEGEGLALLEKALEQSLSQQWRVLSDFTRLYFSEAVDELLRKRLESDDQEIASTAAYLISRHGPAEDQKLIEQRLERWRKDWGNRIAEADSNLQGRLESELIMALGLGKSWKPPVEKFKELQRTCLTNVCKQQFHIQ